MGLESHGSHGIPMGMGIRSAMGMGTKCMGMGIKTWEWGKYSHRNTVLNLKVSKDTDLIHFWLDNKSVLPKLYTVAHSILCVPASSAASERVFSTAGRMLEKHRTNFSHQQL